MHCRSLVSLRIRARFSKSSLSFLAVASVLLIRKLRKVNEKKTLRRSQKARFFLTVLQNVARCDNIRSVSSLFFSSLNSDINRPSTERISLALSSFLVFNKPVSLLRDIALRIHDINTYTHAYTQKNHIKLLLKIKKGENV